ncbi:MAG: diguanylate cyclase [Firmicutes bacterium]|nr:diguanylate cyclase [Bacillota bacterium]
MSLNSMKKKRWIISLMLIVLALVFVGIITFNILSNDNKLTSEERTWINENINNVQNIYVVKDENAFSRDGSGVFYSFLNDFSEEYGIELNIISFDNTNTPTDNNLNYTKNISDNSKVFYTDHYVLVSKNQEILNTNKDLENKTIGVLNSELEYIKSYLKGININFNGYETEKELFEAVNSTINYIILPRIKYIDQILSNNLEIVYHLSDINSYYTLNSTGDRFSSILNKYFTKWADNIDTSLKKEEFKLFTQSLTISDSEIDKLLSIDYRYGFVNNSPYEVIMSGNYGGIIAEYLQEFSEFSGVYFDITKYKNANKLMNALNNGKVDLYFAFNDNMETIYKETSNGINSSLSILTRSESDKMINSIYGLLGETVYVENNSNLMAYLKSIGNIDIKTYETSKELFKLNKENEIIVMDTYIYEYYSDSKLNNYVSKYDTYINNKYTFKINSDYNTLYTLLNKYISYLDNSTMINQGINSHMETIKSGNVLNSIAKYFIISISAILIIGLIVYKNSKKIRIARRIKNTDKIRFIDELTCLKNRAYLSDFIKTWSNNTVYPQTIIVMDLNRLQEINDKHGVLEGDKQIQAAANALIKTQLDNSDLMRSDGNEFVIYTVGYSQKQIINYIHKLNKELKKMPYNYGAEFGYSIIENNLKTIEDALNEAVEDMKNKKASVKE